jgi:hypothetical protein
MQPNSEAILAELAARGFSHAFELSLVDGSKVYGGGIGFDDCHKKVIAAERAAVRSGVKPVGSSEHNIKKYAVNAAPLLMAAE